MVAIAFGRVGACLTFSDDGTDQAITFPYFLKKICAKNRFTSAYVAPPALSVDVVVLSLSSLYIVVGMMQAGPRLFGRCQKAGR